MLLGKMVSTIRAGAALLSAVAIIGQEGVCQSKDTAAAPPPAPPAVTVTGFVDTYFEYNLDRPKSHINELRNFDVTDEQFKVALAEVQVQRATSATSPVGFLVDLDFGEANDIVQSGAPGSLANVRQAYVTLVAPEAIGALPFKSEIMFEIAESLVTYFNVVRVATVPQDLEVSLLAAFSRI